MLRIEAVILSEAKNLAVRERPRRLLVTRPCYAVRPGGLKWKPTTRNSTNCKAPIGGCRRVGRRDSGRGGRYPQFNRGPEGVPLSLNPGARQTEITNEPGICLKTGYLQKYRSECGLPWAREAPCGAPWGTPCGTPCGAGILRAQGVDASAPPWEILEGHRRTRAELQGIAVRTAVRQYVSSSVTAAGVRLWTERSERLTH